MFLTFRRALFKLRLLNLFSQIILINFFQEVASNPLNSSNRLMISKEVRLPVQVPRVVPNQQIELDPRSKSNYFYPKTRGQEQKISSLFHPCFLPKDIQVSNKKLDPNLLKLWRKECLHWLEGQIRNPENYRQTNIGITKPHLHNNAIRLASSTSKTFQDPNLNTKLNSKILQANKSFNIQPQRIPGIKHQRKDLIKVLDRNFHSFLLSRKRKEKSKEQPNKIQSPQSSIGGRTFIRPVVSLAQKVPYHSPSAVQSKNRLINSDYSSPTVKFNLDIEKEHESFPIQEWIEPLFNYEDIFHSNNITALNPIFDKKRKVGDNMARFSLNENIEFGQELPEVNPTEQYYYQEKKNILEPYYHEQNLRSGTLKQDRTSEEKPFSFQNSDVSISSAQKIPNETYSISKNNYLSRNNDASISRVLINEEASGKNEKNSGSGLKTQDGRRNQERLKAKLHTNEEINSFDTSKTTSSSKGLEFVDNPGCNPNTFTENEFRNQKTITSENYNKNNKLQVNLENSLRVQFGSTSNDEKISDKTGSIIRSSNDYVFQKLLKNWMALRHSRRT